MQRKIRVLAISHSAVVSDYRIRHRCVAEDERIDLTLLCPEHWRQFNRECQIEPEENDESYKLIIRQPFDWGFRHHGLRNVSHFYPGLKRIVAECKPDILELWEEPFAAVTWQALRALKKNNPSGKAIFFSAQNIDRRYPPPFSWFEYYTYRYADICFAMSREVVGVLENRGWKKSSIVLPLGIDWNKYEKLSDGNAVRLHFGLQSPVIGFCGRVDEKKGIDDLLAACVLLKRDGKDFSLLVVGDGAAREKSQQFCKDNGIQAVFTGVIPNEEIPSCLAVMDIVVIPSRTTEKWKEQFGRSAVEAMAAGKAIVVSNSGELPNVVAGCGIVVPERNPQRLAAEVKQLFDDSERRLFLGQSARELAKREYSWQSIACRQIETYLNIFKKTGD